MAVFPKPSLAVMVRLSVAPAVGVVVAAASVRVAAFAAFTVMTAVPVTEDSVAARLFGPAANSVAVSVVVLTPLVNDTLEVGYDGAVLFGLVDAPDHVIVWLPL
jgi:hypothetical protein